MRIFMFAAALRAESTNKKLINIAADLVKQSQHEVDLASFSEFMLPLYDGDMEKKSRAFRKLRKILLSVCKHQKP